MTRLRARCHCGCTFEAFALPPGEHSGKWIARTRSGFAACLHLDPEVFGDVHACLNAPAAGAWPDRDLIRWVALLGDPAPNGERYDTALGPLCPRCGGEPEQVRPDRRLPEVLVALPSITHYRWLAAGEQARWRLLATVRTARAAGRLRPVPTAHGPAKGPSRRGQA